MISPARTSHPHHRPWQRLIALLVVLAFALASLPGHATTAACQVECAQMSMSFDERPDVSDACGGCAAPATSLSPAVMAPDAMAAPVATLVSDHIPQPPRRPPRT
ncbi:hypothetical protein [Halomonas sp. SL1]|uniref:hypothetical protein n=1 Tax=Halomonas sp. SL1 TaxID=2137478 RepID=UPI000D15A4EA|nr:hypothetical protein [Halomonas sp. SL1]RAH38178.1 hypothetical protein C9J49_007060 [Halomonas sp. SL1]